MHWRKGQPCGATITACAAGPEVDLGVCGAVAAGVVSGTIVAVQLTLLWPRFMELVGQIISTPFLIEVFAFFLEAIFTAVYVYGGERISHKGRLAAALLVTLGAALGPGLRRS